MRKTLYLAVGLIAIAALPAAALAGVVGSVHDLPAFYGYTTTAQAKQGTCSFCHIPHKAASGGDRLFPKSYSAGLPGTWSSDSLSNVCWYCHGAGSGYATAEEVNPFSGTSHLRNSSLLTGGIRSGDPGDIGTVPTDLNLVGNQLRCVSCHKIHDNTVKPFLAWGGSGDFSARDAGTLSFCGKCHPNRSNTNTYGAANPGNHPSSSAYADTGAGSPVVGAALPLRMQVDMTSLSNALAGAWNLGGHAQNTGGTENNVNFVCGTCHAVHSNETGTWDAADGGTVVGTAVTPAGDPILVDKGTANLVAELSAPICVDCHSIAFGASVRGPGATGTFSHPVGTQSATATVMFNAGEGYKWNNAGANSMIVCQSCHDIHWSATNHTGGTSTGSYLIGFQCSECHSVAGTAYANHHPSNIAVTSGTHYVAGAQTSSDTDWSARTQTKTGTAYVFRGGIMSCETCHGGALATAHNNAAGFPGLVGRNTESDMCVDCHSVNPSVYSLNNGTGAVPANTQGGTHFVGSITTAGYKRTTTFVPGATDNVAKYSTDGGTNGSIICESCHTLKINGKNGHVVSYRQGNNTGDGQAQTQDIVDLMLQASGNAHGTGSALPFNSSDANLCTACHGGSPGGGLTHPVLPSYTANASGNVTIVAPASATAAASGQINCESCHRPHDAATASQDFTSWAPAWILELATATTYIDYSPLCGNCHASQH